MVNEELVKSLAAKATEKKFEENPYFDIKSYYQGYRDALLHFANSSKFEELLIIEPKKNEERSNTGRKRAPSSKSRKP